MWLAEVVSSWGPPAGGARIPLGFGEVTGEVAGEVALEVALVEGSTGDVAGDVMLVVELLEGMTVGFVAPVFVDDVLEAEVADVELPDGVAVLVELPNGAALEAELPGVVAPVPDVPEDELLDELIETLGVTVPGDDALEAPDDDELPLPVASEAEVFDA